MSSFVGDVLKSVARGETLDAQTAEAFMDHLMAGEVTAIQTAGLLAAMAVRGETIHEIVGFAKSMRKNAVSLQLPYDVVDTCGTGGDGADTFNISTSSAFVAAAVGTPIAKHGNRAVSSKSGSADVLQALGARIDLDEEDAKLCLDETKLCFLFAPGYHPAMKHAVEPRKQLGFRTIFNILGPLTNPAGASRQVLGVFRSDLVQKVAYALRELGTQHAMVVHGAGGIDELSLAGETLVAEVRNGEVFEYVVTPEQVGLSRAPLETVKGGDAPFNADVLQQVFSGRKGPQRDIVVLNAGAALYVGGKASDLLDGVRLAEIAIDSGNALQTLQNFVQTTRRLARTEVAQ